jgi:hypothetical protein
MVVSVEILRVRNRMPHTKKFVNNLHPILFNAE